MIAAEETTCASDARHDLVVNQQDAVAIADLANARIVAVGRDERAARSVLRLTLGRSSTTEDVDAVLAVLPEAYDRASGSRTADRS